MRYRAVIFDLDGTLLDTLEDLADSVNYALEKFGFPRRSLEEIRQFVGNGVRVLMERAVPSGTETPDLEACLACFKAYYAGHMQNKTRPYDGIEPLLQNLQSSGYRIAVVSNKFDAAVKELCREWFPKTVSVAVGESETVAKKPSPQGVWTAMKELGCLPGEIVYVGDSEVDVQTAKNANIACISVLWGFRDREWLKENGAAMFAESPAELQSLLFRSK